MKKILLVAIVFAFSLTSFAQENAQPSKSRAEVRQELLELEQAGYNPNDWLHYPENIQAAEKIVWEKHHQKKVYQNN